MSSRKKETNKSSNPAKAKQNTVKNNSNNYNGEVTIQMHNNLRKAIDNTDQEINQFANRNESE